jgi:hypothetical protein
MARLLHHAVTSATPALLEYFARARVKSLHMAQKRILLAALGAALVGIFIYANRDWFFKHPIQISHRRNPFGGRFDPGAGPAPLMFEFDRRLKLTSIKVISVSEAENSKIPHALWQMISDSNSVPTKGFTYGMAVPGMRPVYKVLTVDPLDPAKKYRLLIEAGSLRAQHDFSLDPEVR